MINLNSIDTFPEFSDADLSRVSGGAAPSTTTWQQIRTDAAPYCPKTVNAYPTRPLTRAKAEVMGAACISEMGPFYASMGGTAKVNAGIEKAFPRK